MSIRERGLREGGRMVGRRRKDGAEQNVNGERLMQREKKDGRG